MFYGIKITVIVVSRYQTDLLTLLPARHVLLYGNILKYSTSCELTRARREQRE